MELQTIDDPRDDIESNIFAPQTGPPIYTPCKKIYMSH